MIFWGRKEVGDTLKKARAFDFKQFSFFVLINTKEMTATLKTGCFEFRNSVK